MSCRPKLQFVIWKLLAPDVFLMITIRDSCNAWNDVTTLRWLIYQFKRLFSARSFPVVSMVLIQLVSRAGSIQWLVFARKRTTLCPLLVSIRLFYPGCLNRLHC